MLLINLRVDFILNRKFSSVLQGQSYVCNQNLCKCGSLGNQGNRVLRNSLFLAPI